MLESLNTKNGVWAKKGNKSSDPNFPGSYGDYFYIRSAPNDYKKTDQQKKIGKIGRKIGKNCKGETGSDFVECRNKYI